MELIVDDRERAVVKYLEDYSHEFNMVYAIRRLAVGDYAIVYKSNILIIVERKTWVDLAASMRDGRKYNVEKLMALRDSVGCHIAYLIEGCAQPPAKKLIGNIPAKNLRAHLDHLAFRDGIHMIYANDSQSTAYRLFELMRNYLTSKVTVFAEIDELVNKPDMSIQSDQDNKIVCVLPEQLFKSVSNSSVAYQEFLLKCIPSIGSVISALLIENKITLYVLFSNKITIEDLAVIKYTSGGSLGIERAQKIFRYIHMLSGDSQISIKTQQKMLASIPLISALTAKIILQTVKIPEILSGNIGVNELKNISRGKTKLGTRASENIINILLNKY